MTQKTVEDLVDDHAKLRGDYQDYMNAYELHIGKALDGLRSMHYVALGAMAIVVVATLFLATGLVTVQNEVFRWFLILCIAVGTFGEFANKRMTKRYGNLKASLPKSFAIHMESALAESNQLKNKLTASINNKKSITQDDILNIAKTALDDLNMLGEKIDWILGVVSENGK